MDTVFKSQSERPKNSANPCKFKVNPPLRVIIFHDFPWLWLMISLTRVKLIEWLAGDSSLEI